MATISNFVTHIVSSNVNLMNNNRLKRAKDMTFYDPSSNKPSTVLWWISMLSTIIQTIIVQ